MPEALVTVSWTPKGTQVISIIGIVLDRSSSKGPLGDPLYSGAYYVQIILPFTVLPAVRATKAPIPPNLALRPCGPVA